MSHRKLEEYSQALKELLILPTESQGAAAATSPEDELRRNQQILQALVDGAAAAIFVKDVGGRFLLVNRRFEALLGKDRNEIVGHRDEELFSRAALQRFRAGDQPALDACRAVEYEEEVARGEEIRTYLSSRFPLFDLDGELHAVCGISTDVTDRKRLETQLRRAQKMEAVGQLAGGVAHDFNNLLTAILGYSQLLADQLGARPDLCSHVEEIRKAGERAAALTRQLLAFGRQQVLQPRVIDLNAVVADIAALLRRLIGEDVELITALRSGPVGVLVDPGQVEQVLVNLAVNARDAMPKGGKLTLETADVELDEIYAYLHPDARPGPHVLLAVSDTGEGMDRETQSHIFEPFFTTKGQHQGTGLGLSTVYGIVLQSGGHIEVHSETGRGSTFKIYFPRVEAEVRGAAESAAPAAARAAGSETVLLLEDEAALRDLIRDVLQDSGYTVLEAGIPAAALALASSHPGPIHLLLTDVVMPRMGGPEVAEQVVRLHPRARVLYMSGYAGHAIGRHPLPAGAPLLEKPFSVEGLLQQVRRVLDGAPG